MANEYIEFNNNTQPAVNDTNLNRLQQLIKQDIQGAVSGDTLPVGAIMPFGSDTIPENWLLCNGQAVSREDYQQLFNTIGTTYGQGDGFTTFNLPNLQGKVVVGKDDNDTDFDMLGETGGEKTHTLTIDEMPTHKHQTNIGVALSPETGGYRIGESGVVRANDNTNRDSQNTGGGQPHNILQPYQVHNYIIKAKQSAGVVATVVDSLNSASTTDALSANQGKIINEKIQELTTYSTEEQVIGTWIDGNPIYRKSFNIGNITSDVEINTNITNFAELISATGRGKLENQYWATLPQTNIQASGVYFAINLNSDGSKIQIKRSSNSFRSVVIILEYTKTTD